VDSSVNETVRIADDIDSIEELVGPDSVARFSVSQGSALANSELVVFCQEAQASCHVVSKLG